MDARHIPICVISIYNSNFVHNHNLQIWFFKALQKVMYLRVVENNLSLMKLQIVIHIPIGMRSAFSNSLSCDCRPRTPSSKSSSWDCRPCLELFGGLVLHHYRGAGSHTNRWTAENYDFSVMQTYSLERALRDGYDCVDSMASWEGQCVHKL